VQGEIMDLLVDIRVGSPTYLKQVNIELNSESGISILIATGVAHGFSVPKETSAICYLNTSEYSSKFEKSLNPLDHQLKVDWRLPEGVHAIISKSDASATSFQKARNTAQLPSYFPSGL
jgi:dTDP-4-dehydrorhamnose 3,5-epimerase-like enzyme